MKNILVKGLMLSMVTGSLILGGSFEQRVGSNSAADAVDFSCAVKSGTQEDSRNTTTTTTTKTTTTTTKTTTTGIQ